MYGHLALDDTSFLEFPSFTLHRLVSLSENENACKVRYIVSVSRNRHWQLLHRYVIRVDFSAGIQPRVEMDANWRWNLLNRSIIGTDAEIDFKSI